MIVRDNESTIRACLESIRPWVDEMVVVDTGSRDRTPDICRELGARVFHHPWADSFSAARNLSLGYARGEWLFWMDSDDVIPEDCGRRLRELVDGAHDPGGLGYVMQVHCPGPGLDGQNDVTVVRCQPMSGRSRDANPGWFAASDGIVGMLCDASCSVCV